MRYLIALLICLPALSQEPRGREFLPQVQPDDLDATALYTEVVTPITVRRGEAPMKPDEQRIVVHARPVWRLDDDGKLAPISTAIESGIEALKSVWRNDGNTVRFRVTEDGVCIYRAGSHELRVRPAKVQAEATDATSLAEAEQVKPTDNSAESDRVIQIGSFAGVRFEHIVEPGAVKEIAWLDTMPAGVATARFYILAYQWQSDTLSPAIVGGEVLWKSKDGDTILRWPAPVVTDAKGKELRASYRTRVALPNIVGIQVNATDLRAATYPVAIDPTTTTALGDSLAGRSIRTSSTLKYKSMFVKINLPDMTGNTVTDAEWQLVATDVVNMTSNVNVYARATAETGAWDTSSTYTTLDALSLGTAVASSASISSGAGTKTINIFGDATKGVSKFYADHPTGGAITLALSWTGYSGTLNSANASMKIGDGDVSDPYAAFAFYNNATNYPRITITYTTSGGSSNGSFFFGG